MFHHVRAALMIFLFAGMAWLGGFLSSEGMGQDKDKKAKGMPPQPLFCSPLAIEVGKANKVIVRGLRLEKLTNIIIHDPKCTGRVLSTGKKVGLPNNQMKVEVVGDCEAEIEITLPKDFVGGTVAFSLSNADGEGTRAVCLVKDEAPIVAEKEPNDGFKQAQKLEVGQVVEGAISRGQDVDVYQISLSGKKTYLFNLQALRAGSPLDPILTLHDTQGRTIETGEPSSLDRDPWIRFTPKQDTLVYLSVQDAHDQGAPFFLYRLAITAER
ncbi:MAG: hypothetical protein N2112_08290 [Gemmataceae bacterium]|jgi:hypothetical protein|nr:hypothetical protein [Gemmataceae bacterium]